MADRSSRPPPSQSPPRSAETALIQGTGQTRLRPADQRVPIYWNAHHRFTPLSGPPQAATDPLSMPPEYAGLIV